MEMNSRYTSHENHKYKIQKSFQKQLEVNLRKKKKTRERKKAFLVWQKVSPEVLSAAP